MHIYIRHSEETRKWAAEWQKEWARGGVEKQNLIAEI